MTRHLHDNYEGLIRDISLGRYDGYDRDDEWSLAEDDGTLLRMGEEGEMRIVLSQGRLMPFDDGDSWNY